MKTTRICIYPKDIQRITGRSERYGRKQLERIREHLKHASMAGGIETLRKYQIF
jgi:hypothetical protein